MKFIVGLSILVSVLAFASALDCGTPEEDTKTFPQIWKKMEDKCTDQLKVQIQAEIGASISYLKIAAHFSRDTVNRPGFAEFFFNAAREEREHAIQLIEYMSMRGQLVSNFKKLTVPKYLKEVTIPDEWSGADALKYALELETEVTGAIRTLIAACEGDKAKDENDYHLVDYLTGVYLEEQHKGQRDIAGKLSTLKKMISDQGGLAEFLFDKDL